MPKKKMITEFKRVPYPVDEYITKFGGQPNWIGDAQWPISSGWDNRPMMFVGQILLESSIFGNKDPKMAYIFLTHQKSVEDDFFDPDIAEFNGDENAVIIQPDGLYDGETVNIAKGPTIFDKKNRHCEFIPKLKDGEDPYFMKSEEFIKISSDDQFKYLNEIDGNKIGGTPNFFQEDFDYGESWKLLLQLNSSCLPFYLNLGVTPTVFALINNELNKGGLYIQDM